MNILYIHGYNGSPQGEKTDLLRQRFNKANLIAPQHNSRPQEVFALLDSIAEGLDELDDLIVGTSLGGFWANFFAQRYGLRAVLINPAVQPSQDLARLGCEFAADYAPFEQQVSRKCHTPKTVLLAEDDEVLAYQHAQQMFTGSCEVRIFPTGGHRMCDPLSLERIATAIDELKKLPFAWIDEECLLGDPEEH